MQYKNDGTVVACCESEQDNLLTFRSIKRLIGKNIEDLQENESYLPCKYIMMKILLSLKFSTEF